MWNQLSKTEDKLVYKHSTTGEECNLSLIYTGQEGTYYAFDNILTMPIQRQFIFDQIQQYEQIGMDKDELTKTIAKIKDLIQKGNSLDAYSSLTSIENKLKDHWDISKTSLLVAAVVIVKEDEPIDFFNQELANEKLEMWAKNNSLIGFFLNIAQSKCKKASDFLNPSSPNASEAKVSKDKT